MARNVNCLIETKRLMNVTGCQVHCKCGNISETVTEVTNSCYKQTTNRK